MRTLDPRLAVLFAGLSMLLGCTKPVTRTENARTQLKAIRPDEDVTLTFKNGGRLQIEPHHFRWTDSSGPYLMGSGRLRRETTSRSSEAFEGWVRMSEIDSTTMVGSDAAPIVVAHLRNGSTIYFDTHKMRQMPNGAPGEFWCIGSYTVRQKGRRMATDSVFVGRIDPSELEKIEVGDASMKTTSYALQGIGALLALPLVIAAATFLAYVWR